MKRFLPVVLVLAGCGAGETSVSLVFPNAVSQSTVRRLRVEAYSPDTGTTAMAERDCSDFENLAREGKDPIGTPVRGDYQCVEPCGPDWLNDRELAKVPKGRQIIYVLGYASAEEDATPVLEGCTDRFDSEGGKDDHVEVEILLKLVLPESARMVKSAGDRQVGRGGEELAVPLRVRVEADSPDGSSGTYVIPGVPVEFTSEVDGFNLLGETKVFTDAEGHASVLVQLPGEPGSGRIVAYAAELEMALDPMDAERATQPFSVSVTEPVVAGSASTIDALGGARPVAVALGDLGGGAGLDLAVLGCNGANCEVGQNATEPFGESVLAVVLDAGTSPTNATVPSGLGALPAAMVVADVAPPAGRDEVAFANSRRADCLAQGCEGSEILILEESGGSMTLAGRYTMTGSNAVGLTTFATSSTPYLGLAMAAQGRSRNTQACSRASRCLPLDEQIPEEGGCPPGERCECTDCNSTNDPGVCVARDKMIDLLVSETLQTGPITYNKGGCQMPVVTCDNNDAEQSICQCLDDFRKNECTGRDGCNCKVPDRIYIGDTDAPVLPFSLVSGPLKTAQDWDIVVPSIGGLELVESQPGGTFKWKGEPIINAPIHAAAIADLDFALEEVNGDPHRADVVWYARSTCLGGSNFGLSCPVRRDLPEGQTPIGCLGVYYTDGESSIFDLRTPVNGGCRRHHLDFLPDGMCTGDFNGDEHADVAVATRERGTVYIFSGDGRGGLLDPPDEMALPGGGVGGPLACGDVDADGLDDVVATNAVTGAIYVLRAAR